MKEQWKDIEGFEGKYQVSNLGRFKRISKNGEKQMLVRFDYKLPRIVLSKNGVQRPFPVCVLVAKAFLENPNGFKYVRYKNGYKMDNRVSNLEFVERCNGTDISAKIL